jgi:uncharacterized protein involved in outer membrane biogenesis
MAGDVLSRVPMAERFGALMKKLIYGATGVVLTLLVAALVVPGMIDWNDYKKEITDQVRAATGRDLFIDGNIEATILPAPVLVVNKIRLANIEGATSSDMLRLRSFEVRVALMPLLGGRLQVETIRLLRPVLDMEVLADGRSSLVFDQPEKEEAPSEGVGPTESTPESGPVDDEQAPAVKLDNITIEQGLVIYRDAKTGAVERISNINARFAAESLQGPFESEGGVVARGIALDYAVSVGEIINERTAPFSLALALAQGDAEVQISGAMVGLASEPKFKGKISGKGKNLGGVVRAVLETNGLPGVLTQTFSLGAGVVASAKEAEIKDLSFSLGDVKATGDASLVLGDVVDASVRLAVNKIDLDHLLALPEDKPQEAEKKPEKASPKALPQEASNKTAQTAGPSASIPLEPPVKGAAGAGGFSLPSGVNAAVEFSLDVLTFQGAAARKIRLNADLANEEITVSQISAQLPGASDLYVSGFVTAEGEQPRFDGSLEVSVGDFQGFLEQIGVKGVAVSPARLHKMELAAAIEATPLVAAIKDIGLKFDSSKITGAVKLMPGARPKVAVDLALNKIDLDAYLPSETAQKQEKPTTPAATSSEEKAETAADQKPPPAPNPFAALSALSGIDTDLKLKAGSIIFHKKPIKGLLLDVSLRKDALKLNQARVTNAAGLSAEISGGIQGLSKGLRLKNWSFKAKAKNLDQVFKLAGVVSPDVVKKLGAVAVVGDAGGSLLKPAVNINLIAADTKMSFSGTVSPLDSGLNAKVTAKHGDANALLKKLGASYRPSGRLGALDFQASVKGNPSAMVLSEMSAKLGKMTAVGNLKFNLKGKRPRIGVDIKAGRINVDPFLPAGAKAKKQAKSSSGAQTRKTGAKAAAPGGVSDHWSKEPMDLSGLSQVDADIRLEATSLSFEKQTINKLAMMASLEDGAVDVRQLDGTVYEGSMRGKAHINSNDLPKLGASLVLKGSNLAKANMGVASGALDFDIELEAAGRSEADMVSSLGGGGTLSLARLDVLSGTKGSVLSGVLSLVQGLNKVGGLLGGSKKGSGLADVSSAFTIKNGLVNLDKAKLVSNIGNGDARGKVDLPAWRIDVDGEVALAQNLLIQLINRSGKKQTNVPFRVSGVLDAPDVKVDTSGVAKNPVKPVIDKVLGKTGLGKILNKVLPGGQSGAPKQPSQGAPQPQPQPQQQQKKGNQVKDLFDSILKGVR